MRFLSFNSFFHTHDWELPRRTADGGLVVECYACGNTRRLKVSLPQSSRHNQPHQNTVATTPGYTSARTSRAGQNRS